MKQPKNDYIERDDFAPFLHGAPGCGMGCLHYLLLLIVLSTELLKYHPGLEFLGGTPEFQEKYGK